MAWLLPDGGPFKVPGAAGVVGFGFVVVLDGPAVGEDRETVVATGVPPPTGGTAIAIKKAAGHRGPEVYSLYPRFVGCRLMRIRDKGWRTCGMKLDIGRLACIQDAAIQI